MPRRSSRRQAIASPTTPLHRAVKYGDAKKVEELLAEGHDANTSVPDESDEDGVRIPPGGVDREHMLKVFLQSASRDSEFRSKGGSLLNFAAITGNLDVLTALLNGGALLNSVDKSGKTALHTACSKGYDDFVEALLSAGAAINIKDNQGRTPLGLIAEEGKENIMRLLLNAGADVSEANGVCAMHSVHDGAPRCGGMVQRLKLIPCTPLMRVSAEGDVGKVNCLLDIGVDPNTTDEKGASALMWATSLPVVTRLLESGASPTAVDAKGNTVLHHYAKENMGRSIICTVYKAGANPTLRNRRRKTASDVAREEGNESAATLLDTLAKKYVEKEKLRAKASGAETKAGGESDADDKEQQLKVLQPCLCCGELTHRCCARCRITFICSRECQLATYKDHRPRCFEIYQERQDATNPLPNLYDKFEAELGLKQK